MKNITSHPGDVLEKFYSTCRKHKALIFSMKVRHRLLHLPRSVSPGRRNAAQGTGTLGLSTTHLHADDWFKDYWDSAEERHSGYKHTHLYTHTHTITLALTCVCGLVPWRCVNWSQ